MDSDTIKNDAPAFQSVGFIGLGLIGGSIAKTIRRIYPDTRIIAYNRSVSALDAALKEGTIDEAGDVSLASFCTCDLIFICTPVITALDFMKTLKPFLKEGALITDVGSVKTEIHNFVEANGLDGYFIGGHPMAGSEKTGYANATDRLIENAWYILTPGGEVPIERISAFSEYISALGALPLVMTYEEHDRVTAGISHLPQVVSAALVNLVHDLDGEDGCMKTIAAGGFRDITRISSSSPQMWQEICLSNSENICAMLDAFISRLIDYRLAIRNENADSILKIFTNCKEFRDSFDVSASGQLKSEYRIYLDLIDEAGSIARIAGILAETGISIKNIGIVHNREFEQGVLRIVFYDDDASQKAAALLEGRGYRVYA